MAHFSLSLLFFSLLAIAVAGNKFADENPIKEVISKNLNELENSIVQIIGHTRHSLSFARFARRYEKSYETAEEMKVRFSVFSENLEMIRSHNKKKLSYRLGVNQFADLTWEEFRKHRLGAAQNCSATTKGNHKLTDVVLPEKKDWREKGIISPVKNQGHCGSCWTFR